MSPKLKNKKINNIILNKNNSIFDAVRKLNKSDFQVCLLHQILNYFYLK